ncbi:MAG: Lrp/AsnC family transcriptional regulator [Oscillospiraceae bacterium]|nr:Lrp/AsnC family transcriptional regulator [Oscillospiraceae bacterium]
MENLKEQILNVIEKDAKISAKELSAMLGAEEAAVLSETAAMESDGTICAYHTLINRDRLNGDDVTALVELRVTPQGGDGYDKIAETICMYDQVDTLYLMSGAYDFLVIVKGKTIKEISLFVSGKLASMHEVQNTTTHFILTRYKEQGIRLKSAKTDGRMVICP